MRMAAVVTLAALAALGGTGCSLILDFDQGGDGGPAPADAGPPDGAGADALVDPNEPNDDSTTATVVNPGTHGPFAIDPAADVDVFRFTVPGDIMMPTPRDVTVEVLFSQAQGDLDLFLHDSAFTIVDQSTGFEDNESIARLIAAGEGLNPGDYYIRVVSFEARDTNTYSLVLTIP